MSENKFIKTRAGRQLFELLPEFYRTRDTTGPDASGDLARYLDACGHLLDLIRNTLDQRLADIFPDISVAGPVGQTWLLPYIADLLDVHMASPDEAGRREEVANAVAWRQRKGTFKVLEEIAEQVGRLEVEVQEGWKRVALTPRVGLPLLPARALGESGLHDDFQNHPNWAARHPNLNSSFVDLRYPSRAMQIGVPPTESPQNPAGKQTQFGDTWVWWRQINPHGAPCFPGSYEDIARRTADVRTPDWRQGHCHPKRAILYAPPPLGFFEPGRFPVQGDTEFSSEQEHVIEDRVIDGRLSVTAGRLHLRRCAVRSLHITAPSADGAPVLVAEDCLLNNADVRGAVQLEYCTVLQSFSSDRLQASDCLFVGALSLSPATEAAPHCIRFSRVPRKREMENLLTYLNTTEPAVFYEFEFEEGGQIVRRPPVFGEPGCAVLHPAVAESIRFGAEDGGEMGAHHGWRYSLLLAAVQDKLNDFLPVGIEAVIVPDLRLHRLPREAC